MFGGDPGLWILVRNLGGSFPAKFGGPKTSKFQCGFGQLRDLIANICITQQLEQDIVNLKTALQTKNTPAQANLIRFTLVHKRRKI